MSFQAPLETIALLASSVRFVPPTASTFGDVAGQDVWDCFSAAVSSLAGTPRAHADDPRVPGRDDDRDPERAVAASWRSTMRARRRVRRDAGLALAVGDRDHVRQRRPDAAACTGAASMFEEAEDVAVVGVLVERR